MRKSKRERESVWMRKSDREKMCVNEKSEGKRGCEKLRMRERERKCVNEKE